KGDLLKHNTFMSKELINIEMEKIQVELDSAFLNNIKLKREIREFDNARLILLNEIKKLESNKRSIIESPKIRILNRIDAEQKYIEVNLGKSKIHIKNADSLITRINNQLLSYFV